MRSFIVITTLTALLVPTTPAASARPHSSSELEAVVKAEATYGRLPVSFEQNVGQTDSEVAFLARAGGYTLFLTPSEMVLSLPGPRQQTKIGRLDVPASQHTAAIPPSVLRMRLVGADPTVVPVGENRLEHKTNYFIGNDPLKWHTDVPNFGRVRYAGIYPGVELVYYDKQGSLEYDFEIAPGADPWAIVMEWEGADSIEIESDGGLVLGVGSTELRVSAPVLYQETARGKTAIAGQYARLGAKTVGVNTGAYDSSLPLVIDPLLTYSTFLGGNGHDCGLGIDVDGTGAAYVTGETESTNFPRLGALDSSYNGQGDVFVTKLSASGNSLVYSTYLGGARGDTGSSIAVDRLHCAHITGVTDAPDFPMVAAVDSTYDDAGHPAEAFVAKLSAGGNSLVYSTFLGGSDIDYALSIAVDASAGAYVTGYTDSSDFPTGPGYDSSISGFGDTFVVKLEWVGSPFLPLRIAYSTMLGGDEWEVGYGVAVDGSGHAYVTGVTVSSNFPLLDEYSNNADVDGNTFVTKLSPDGTYLVYSTYLGGTSAEYEGAIAVDASGNAFVTGSTESSDFPTLNAIDSSYAAPRDLFVTKFGASGDLLYSTFLGGSAYERTTGIAVDLAGSAYVTGGTESVDFPTLNDDGHGHNGSYEVFVSKLSPSGNALEYSTFLGGSGSECATSIALDTSGHAYITGGTESINFRRRNAYQLNKGFGWDSFVAKF